MAKIDADAELVSSNLMPLTQNAMLNFRARPSPPSSRIEPIENFCFPKTYFNTVCSTWWKKVFLISLHLKAIARNYFKRWRILLSCMFHATHINFIVLYLAILVWYL